MKFSDIRLDIVTLSDFAENSYIISLKDTNECVVIDPGMDPEPLIQKLNQENLSPLAFLVTHGHWDHIGGISLLRTIWNATPIFIGKNEDYKLTDPDSNLSSAFGFPQTTFSGDRLLNDGETIELGCLKIQVFETPGHSSGHVVYLLDTDDQPLLFSGDLIFSGSIGRTDFPDGNMDQMMLSIKTKVLSLPNNTLIFPGHGSSTSLELEKRRNPFLRNLQN